MVAEITLFPADIKAKSAAAHWHLYQELAKKLNHHSSLLNPQPMHPNNRIITILGMHRSGTSALTGSLEQAGLYIGDTNWHAEDNIRGNRESVEIMTLHNDLLERNGGAWDNPVRNMQWEPVHRALQTAIIRSFKDQPIWGFKDPRTLLTTDMWLKAIPTLELVGIFRHPFLVADSLMRRNAMPAEDALDLWFVYNINLLWLAQNKDPFPIIEFTVDSDKFNKQLELLITTLGLNNSSVNFFDEKLRRQSLPEFQHTRIAQRCISLYESIKELSDKSLELCDRAVA